MSIQLCGSSILNDYVYIIIIMQVKTARTYYLSDS